MLDCLYRSERWSHPANSKHLLPDCFWGWYANHGHSRKVLACTSVTGDWLYKEYKLSRTDCKSFVPLVAFSAFPTATSSLWLRQCHYIREFIFEQLSNPDFVTNITLAPLPQNPMETSYSNSLVKPLFKKQFQIVFNISTQGLRFNQIQCGKVTGAASPTTLAFTKIIKVDLSPTRVDSSARTFILLLLSMILVKSFFFICEDTRPVVSMATVVLITFLKINQTFKVCERFVIFFAIGLYAFGTVTKLTNNASYISEQRCHWILLFSAIRKNNMQAM